MLWLLWFAFSLSTIWSFPLFFNYYYYIYYYTPEQREISNCTKGKIEPQHVHYKSMLRRFMPRIHNYVHQLSSVVCDRMPLTFFLLHIHCFLWLLNIYLQIWVGHLRDKRRVNYLKYIKTSLIHDYDQAYSIRVFLATLFITPELSYFSSHFQVKMNICE